MQKAFSIILVCLLLSACNVVYKQPIFQGNLLEKTSVDQLKAGMDRKQVFTLLGSPSVEDPFHHGRWDYIATQRRGHGNTEIKTFTVFFNGEIVTRWEGDYFAEQDAQLAAEMAKFGNLPRSGKKRQSQ